MAMPLRSPVPSNAIVDGSGVGAAGPVTLWVVVVPPVGGKKFPFKVAVTVVGAPVDSNPKIVVNGDSPVPTGLGNAFHATVSLGTIGPCGSIRVPGDNGPLSGTVIGVWFAFRATGP